MNGQKHMNNLQGGKTMKTFKVEYREVIMHEFYVDANSEDEVTEKFFEMANESELDFSNGVISEGDIVEIKEV